MRGPGRAAADVERNGYALVPGVLGDDTVAEARRRLDAVFATEDDIAREREWLTDDRRVAYALPAKDPWFVDVCTGRGPVGLARAVLGDDCVLAGCNGFATVPGGLGQPLHPDHPHPTPGTTLYLHLVCPLDPFSIANGATRVVPHSQRRAHLTAEGLDAAGRASLERDAIAVEAAPGDAIALDAAVWHGAGPNTTDAPRRALHLFYGRRWVQPHWDFPASLPETTARALTDEQRWLLGYECSPARYDAAARRSFGYGWG